MATKRQIERARARIERNILTEECTITRRDDDSGLGAFNDVLGTYDAATGGTVLVSGHPCYVNWTPSETGAKWMSVEAIGAVDQNVRVRMPWSTPILLPGDRVEITRSDRPDMEGLVFDVKEDDLGTGRASKVIRCSYISRGDRGRG